jgi:integration host factor subunit alpha
MALTKAMIVDGIHEQLGYPKNKSAEMLETLLELIKSNLEKGEDVLISGFGKFCVKEKNERRGRNPATGNDMLLDRTVNFRAVRISNHSNRLIKLLSWHPKDWRGSVYLMAASIGTPTSWQFQHLFTKNEMLF